MENAGALRHDDDGLDVVVLEGEVDEVLVEAAVVDLGGDGEIAGGEGGRDAELVAHHLRTTGLNGVVVGDDAVRPDLVEVVECAFLVDEAVGEAVGALVEVAVGLEEAGLHEDGAVRRFDGELHPGLVHVALLGHVGVGGPLVLDDDGDGDGVAGVKGEGGGAKRGDEGASRLGPSSAKRSTLKTPAWRKALVFSSCSSYL